MKTLVRAQYEKKLLGVCGGVARYFGIDPMLVRIGTVAAAFFTGFFPVALAYGVSAALMPER